MDETIVVRCDCHMVELAQRGELAAGCEAAEHCAIELQNLNSLILDEGPAGVARHFTLAGRKRDARSPRQQLKFTVVVDPAHGLLEPARCERLQKARGFCRRAEVPSAVYINHEIAVLANDLSNELQPLHVLAQGKAASLSLEPLVTLRLEHLNLLAQFRIILALPVVSAGHVAGHAGPIATEQLVERQARNLADDIPAGDVGRCRNANERLPPPTLLVRQALGRERGEFLVEALRG